MAWLVGHRETKDAANRDATPIVTAPVVDSTASTRCNVGYRVPLESNLATLSGHRA